MPNSIDSSSRYHSDSNSGFTLVELMVTIVVLGIIASIAAPNISNQLANQRVKSTTVTLMSVLKEARAESNINRIPLTVSYDNGNQSNNFINVEAPYAGPLVFASSTRSFDWTNIFLKSAQADMSVPKKPGGGTGDGGTTGGGTTGGGTGDGGTGDGGTGDGGTTGVNSNLVIIATYQYDKKVVIKSSPEKITFKPNRTVDTPMTYTICHSNKSVSPQQVNVSKNGLISSKIGGSCQ